MNLDLRGEEAKVGPPPKKTLLCCCGGCFFVIPTGSTFECTPYSSSSSKRRRRHTLPPSSTHSHHRHRDHFLFSWKHTPVSLSLLHTQSTHQPPLEKDMLTSAILLNRQASRTLAQTVGRRALSTQVDKVGRGPIAEDGRHEVWREGIYDHDNEPK